MYIYYIQQGSATLGTRATTGTWQHNHWHTCKIKEYIYTILYISLKNILYYNFFAVMRQHIHWHTCSSPLKLKATALSKSCLS